MLTWEEVKVHIRQNYNPTEETDTYLQLRCEFPRVGFQNVHVNLRDTKLGGPAVEIVAAVGDTARINAVDALTYNHSAHMGALVLRGETLLLRTVLLLKDLKMELVDEALVYMASEATRLRVRTASVPVPPDLFAYLTV